MIGDIVEYGFYTICIIVGFVLIANFTYSSPLAVLGCACVGAGLAGWVLGGAE